MLKNGLCGDLTCRSARATVSDVRFWRWAGVGASRAMTSTNDPPPESVVATVMRSAWSPTPHPSRSPARRASVRSRAKAGARMAAAASKRLLRHRCHSPSHPVRRACGWLGWSWAARRRRRWQRCRWRRCRWRRCRWRRCRWRRCRWRRCLPFAEVVRVSEMERARFYHRSRMHC